jgi:signal transduction histidine kinase
MTPLTNVVCSRSNLNEGQALDSGRPHRIAITYYIQWLIRRGPIPRSLSPTESDRQAIEIVWNFFTTRAFWVVGGLLGKLGVEVSIVSCGIPAGIGLAVAHSAGRRRGGARQRRHLTQRILAFSRRQPLSPRPVRLSKLADGMSELIRHSVGEKIQIETHLNAQWWTRCDANQMENVILNLAINARDAIPNGGRLVVETSDRHLAWTLPGVTDFVPGDYVVQGLAFP